MNDYADFNKTTAPSIGGIKFIDPPARPKPPTRPLTPETMAIIDHLKANPGRWALILEDANAENAQRWKKRPGFEARASSIGKTNRRYDIYVRWVGVA